MEWLVESSPIRSAVLRLFDLRWICSRPSQAYHASEQRPTVMTDCIGPQLGLPAANYCTVLHDRNNSHARHDQLALLRSRPCSGDFPGTYLERMESNNLRDQQIQDWDLKWTHQTWKAWRLSLANLCNAVPLIWSASPQTAPHRIAFSTLFPIREKPGLGTHWWKLLYSTAVEG